MGYSFRLAARVLLYPSSHRQDSTYHSLCYTSCGALAGTRNSSMVTREETCCQYFMGFSYRLTTKDILYALSRRQDSTSHSHYVEPVLNGSFKRDRSNSSLRGHSTTEPHPTPQQQEGNILFNNTFNTF